MGPNSLKLVEPSDDRRLETATLQGDHYKRVFWVLVVLVMWAVFLTQVTKLVKSYRNYEIVTTLAVEDLPELSFPDVTVCPNLVTAPLDEDGRLVVTSLPVFYTAFNGLEKVVSNVWSKVETFYGFCWTFHAEETVNRGGPDGGLHFYGRINQYENLTIGGGLRVIIHDQGAVISDQLTGVLVDAGESQSSVEAVRFERWEEDPLHRCGRDNLKRSACRSNYFFNATRML